MLDSPLEQDASRFFDGGAFVEPPAPDTGAPAVYQIVRSVSPDDREVFRLLRRIGYRDPATGFEYLVPSSRDWTTDLTSVPALFTWLVPRTGAHLPAALIHDGLVADTGDSEHLGPDVSRVEADRIFRDAMADSGTGVVRRWLVWTAVTLATLWSLDGTDARPILRHYYRWIMVATMFSIAWTGYQATADLFDQSGAWPCTYELPWITGESFTSEFLSGALWSLLIPIPLSALWLKYWRAGLIASVSLAFLFHITVALVLLTAGYVVLEAAVTSGWQGLRDVAMSVVRRGTTVLTITGLAAALILICNA